MLSAIERVEILLRSLDEARVAYDARSRGGGASLMPREFLEGSYQELERALILMRDGGEDQLLDPATGKASWGEGGFAVTTIRPAQRQLWWHACARYRWGDLRTLLVRVERTRMGPRFLMPPQAELVAGGPNVGSKTAKVRAYCWWPEVRQALADEGLRTLATLMHGGRAERIVLPEVLLRRRLGLRVEDDIVEEEQVAV